MKIQYGFTLVEMAVVLVIIGILLAGFITPYSAQRTYTKISDTGQQLEKIKEALMGFAATQTPARLPCPDTDNDGEEELLCDNVEGDLPWATLGMGKFDEWGNHFRYRVDNVYAQTIPNPADTLSGLAVQDYMPTSTPTSLTALEDNGTSRVIAIIFSRGKNGLPDAENNAPTDAVYTQDVYVEGRFDDILVWLPKSILINRLVVAGKWPP